MRIYNFLFFGILSTFMLISCSNSVGNGKKENDPFRKNLINPFYIDQLFLTPNNFGNIWISKHLDQIDIDKISVIMKGGKNPDNILEKFIYNFDEKGNNTDYNYFHYSIGTTVINQTNYRYTDQKLDKINVYKYFGVGNLPPVFVTRTGNYTVFYKSKVNGKNDSLFFYPSFAQPKIIIDKIGNYVNYLKIYVKEGTSSKSVLDELTKINPDLSRYELSDKTITYTKNDLPIESYHLNENWAQLEKSQTWEYNKYQQPIVFKEWMHGTLIKDISILYNENSLPKKVIYNRKKYYLIYSKN